MEDEKDPYPNKQNICLLFLDVDGVLNTHNREKAKKDKFALSLSRNLIERLKIIVTSTKHECKICLSSAWRLNKHAVEYLKKQLIAMADIDVQRTIIGQTPSIPLNDHITNCVQQRAFEIRSYLLNDHALKNTYNVISFCVIDDLDLSDQLPSNCFVRIDPKSGIADHDIYAVVCKLNQVPLNHDGAQIEQQILSWQSKPKIKLLFIVAMENNYQSMNIDRLRIIRNKTECTLVITKHEFKSKHDIYQNSFLLEENSCILQYVTDLEQLYCIQSWAVLDYVNLKDEKYDQHPTLISRRFIKIDPNQGLVLNDVLSTVSILNKWSF